MTEEPPSYPPPHDSGYPPPNQGYSPPPGPSYPPPPGYPPQQGSIYPPAAGTNGMAIASLVCSLLGWICGVGPILGIIFGVLALGKIKETGQGGRGLAIAGIAIGSVLIVLVTIGGILRAVGEFEHQDFGAPAPAVLTVDATVPAVPPALAA